MFRWDKTHHIRFFTTDLLLKENGGTKYPAAIYCIHLCYQADFTQLHHYS